MTILILLAAVVTAGMAGMMMGDLLFPKEQVIPPIIVPRQTSLSPIPVTSAFPFGNSTATFTITVNGSVLEGARSADKSVRIIGNVSDPVWLAGSYRAMIDDPTQEELYRDLTRQFRAIRTQRDLDQDEYLELIAVYVQSLRYETSESNPVKFPIETVADRAGDCDDKSLLLAGLLSREGYSVALMHFGPEEHMAIGIASDESGYANTGYAFLETTNLSFVGIPPEKLGSGLSLQSTPLVIPVGEGSLRYMSAGQSRYIEEAEEMAKKRAEELEPDIQSLQEDLSHRQQQAQEMKARMQELRNAGNVREYNQLVDSYNAQVSEYNIRLEKYRNIVSRHDRVAAVYNYIITHRFDRKGVYEYIRGNHTDWS